MTPPHSMPIVKAPVLWGLNNVVELRPAGFSSEALVLGSSAA